MKEENNQVADWLSRALPTDVNEDEMIDRMALPVYLAEAQRRVVEGWMEPVKPQELIESYHTAPEEEIKLLTKHEDLLRHASSGRLYVPPVLRERVIASEHLGTRFALVGYDEAVRC